MHLLAASVPVGSVPAAKPVLLRCQGHDEGRFEVITTANSFRGRTLAGIAASGRKKVKKVKKGFDPTVPGSDCQLGRSNALRFVVPMPALAHVHLLRVEQAVSLYGLDMPIAEQRVEPAVMTLAVDAPSGVKFFRVGSAHEQRIR
jgi:hypothetical protein